MYIVKIKQPDSKGVKTDFNQELFQQGKRISIELSSVLNLMWKSGNLQKRSMAGISGCKITKWNMGKGGFWQNHSNRIVAEGR